MERLEVKMESTPGYVLDLKESQVVLNMAKADSLIRDRSTTPEEDEDEKLTEEQREQKAKELVAQIRQQVIANPTAEVSRSGSNPDDDP
jgi:hypothetical protein